MKSRNTTKLLCLALSLLLLAGLFAGCNNNSTPSPSPSAVSTPPATSQTSDAPDESDEPTAAYPIPGDYKLSFWLPINEMALTKYTDYSYNPTQVKAREITGVEIEWIHPTAANSEEIFSLLIVSGDMPDIMRQTTKGYANGPDAAIEDEIFLALDNYLEFAPNYTTLLAGNSTYEKAVTTDLGHLWCFGYFYSPDKNPISGVGYRRDIAESLGITAIPETIAEWDTLLRAMHNGGYENPLSLWDYGTDPRTFTWMGAYNASSTFMNQNGTVVYGSIQPEYKAYLTQMREWYADGLMYPEISFNVSTLVASWGRDETFVGWVGDGFVGNSVFTRGMSENPDVYIACAPFPVLNKGDELHLRGISPLLGSRTAITSSCQNPEIAVRWLDFWYGEEGEMMLNYGVEGETYNLDANGNPVFTDLILDNDGLALNVALVTYCFMGGVGVEWTAPQYDQAPEKREETKQFLKGGSDWVMPSDITLTLDESATFSRIMADITTYVQECTAGFINGSKSLDEFDDFVSKIKDLKIDDATAIQQAALTRYLNR